MSTEKNTTIGIVGQGFVGSAIYKGLKNFHKILTYDLDKEKCNSTHKELCSKSDIIFMCLPTPMRKNGNCDTRILEKAISQFYEIIMNCSLGKNPKHADFLNTASRNRKILIIKSTVPPGTTERINEKFPEIDICFSPEFLTEANSFDDFKNQTRIIIGGPRLASEAVKQMFRKAFPSIPIVKTETKIAEMVKYFTNCFLASKVTFANQMFQVCTDNNIDYNKVCEYALHDKRIGKSHLSVPGPDGDLGFGGHCFPKDLAAMIAFGSSAGGDIDFLKAVQDYNDKCRRIRDWESMEGRAVSHD